MAVTTSLAGWWRRQLTLQSSGTDMVVVGFAQRSQSSYTAALLKGGPLQLLEHVLDAGGIVVAPKDISGSSSWYSLNFLNFVWGFRTVEAYSKMGLMKDL